VSFDQELEELRRTLRDGSVVRGEVLSRWRDFVATGDVFRSLEPGGSWLRHWLRTRLRGRVAPSQPLLDALFDGIEHLGLARAAGALEALREAWRGHVGGAALLAAVPEVGELPEAFRERLARALRDWRVALTDMIQGQALQSRSGAGSLGLDGAAAVLAVLAVSRPDDGNPRGPAAVAAVVLGVLFGADAVEPLAQAARSDLARRTVELLEDERARILAVLDGLGIHVGRGQALLARAAVVEEAR
jgi:hypothetical protein